MSAKMLNSQHLPFQSIIHPPFPAPRRCIQQGLQWPMLGHYSSAKSRKYINHRVRGGSLCLPQQERTIHTDLFRLMQPHLSWEPCTVSSSITVTNFPTIAPVPPMEAGCRAGGCTWKLGGWGLGDCGVSLFLLGRLALLSCSTWGC